MYPEPSTLASGAVTRLCVRACTPTLVVYFATDCSSRIYTNSLCEWSPQNSDTGRIMRLLPLLCVPLARGCMDARYSVNVSIVKDFFLHFPGGGFLCQSKNTVIVSQNLHSLFCASFIHPLSSPNCHIELYN